MKKSICLILLFCFLLSSCKEKLPYRNFEMSHNAMYPSIPKSSLLWATMNPYKSVSDIAYGDIIIYTKGNSTTEYIWRVVALPGDTITTHMDSIWLNGAPVHRKLDEVRSRFKIYKEKISHNKEYLIAIDTTLLEFYKRTPHLNVKKRTIVPENTVFAMGDNRFNAADSRFKGCIPFSSITGKFSSIYRKGTSDIP